MRIVEITVTKRDTEQNYLECIPVVRHGIHGGENAETVMEYLPVFDNGDSVAEAIGFAMLALNEAGLLVMPINVSIAIKDEPVVDQDADTAEIPVYKG